MLHHQWALPHMLQPRYQKQIQLKLVFKLSYSLRTGILPIVFNPELLLIGIENFWHGLTVVITSLIAILVFTASTQGWLFNKLKWYEIIVFLVISMSLFRPGYILDKFYPEFENINLVKNELLFSKFNPEKETHIKITRRTEYGDRYKLIVIEKSSFQNEFNLEEYGINLSEEDQLLRVDTLNGMV